MPIYTRTGDKGTTSLFGGKRISKTDIRVEAYGSVDQLTSFIGLTAVKIKNKNDKKLLTTIQKALYEIMAYLAHAKVDLAYLSSHIKQFEQNIDKLTSQLPKLHRFILPGGTEIGSLFHILRVYTREAERRVVAVFLKYPSKKTELVVQYLNRLSDLFFMLARKYAKGKEIIT